MPSLKAITKLSAVRGQGQLADHITLSWSRGGGGGTTVPGSVLPDPNPGVNNVQLGRTEHTGNTIIDAGVMIFRAILTCKAMPC